MPFFSHPCLNGSLKKFFLKNEGYFCQPLLYLLCHVEVARKELSSEVFCFISQLLLSLFSLIPGNAQEHLPDILQLLSHHSRLKGNLLSSVGSGGTSHALQRLLKVTNESAVWFFIFFVCSVFTWGSLSFSSLGDGMMCFLRCTALQDIESNADLLKPLELTLQNVCRH